MLAINVLFFTKMHPIQSQLKNLWSTKEIFLFISTFNFFLHHTSFELVGLVCVFFLIEARLCSMYVSKLAKKRSPRGKSGTNKSSFAWGRVLHNSEASTLVKSHALTHSCKITIIQWYYMLFLKAPVCDWNLNF